jgi:hypothetical protein
VATPRDAEAGLPSRPAGTQPMRPDSSLRSE